MTEWKTQVDKPPLPLPQEDRTLVERAGFSPQGEQPTADQTIDLVIRTPAPSIKVRVSVVSGPHQGYEFVLSKPCTMTIGRGEQATMRLEHESHLSRLHARLEVSADKVLVFDLGSTNGTLLNLVPIAEATIRGEGTLAFGETQVLVRIESHAPVPPVPQAVGDYEILETIGNGSMASVFKAFHPPSQQTVAIKIIRDELQGAGKHRQLFAREATILSQLNHPGIVRARHFGFTDDRMYLVMDYIPSIDLLEMIDSKPLNERIRVGCWVTIRVLKALYFAHQRGIVHRDVKPSNILSFRDGRHLKVRLSDFGLAKFYQDAGLGGLTEDRSIRGTLGFMSPEQIDNSRSVGPAADIYAVGACLYRFATNKYPAHSFSSTQSLDDQALNQLPPKLSAIIRKATAPDPATRFADAAQFASQLKPFCERSK